MWAEHADTVIGIEPNDDMRERASAANAAERVRYVAGTSYETGLDSDSVNIVTCSQSFHWMEPRKTL